MRIDYIIDKGKGFITFKLSIPYGQFYAVISFSHKKRYQYFKNTGSNDKTEEKECNNKVIGTDIP